VKKATALVLPSELVEDRFWTKVNMEGDCWLWTGTQRASDGIGVFGYDGKIVYAHRFAYVVSLGPLPPRFEVRRSCMNTLCVRPSHLLLIPKGKKAKIDITYFPGAVGDYLM